MADEKVAAEGGAEAPAGPKLIMGMPLPIFILIAVNSLVMIGGIGFVYYVKFVHKPPMVTEEKVVAEIKKKVEKTAAAEDPNAIFTENFAEMTINLRTTPGGANHYATVEVALECNSEVCLGQVKSNKTKIEDAIRMGVSGKSFTELNSLETKFRLKHELLKQINTYLKNTTVTNLYFTNFIVQ
jgi:flagellar protein FliL